MKKHIISSCLAFCEDTSDDILQVVGNRFETLKNIGFEGIDFDTTLLGRVKKDREQIFDSVSKLAKSIGLEFIQCHLPFVPQSNGVPDGDSFNKTVFSALDVAAGLGIKYAVMHPNTSSVPLDEYDRSAEYDKVMTFFEPFVEYANKVGVNMVIENMRSVQKQKPTHRYCASPDELCEIADAFGIGVCWDTGHANITGLCQSDALKYVGDRLKVLHLNDNFGDDDIHIAPFLGSIDWKDVMSGLRAINYSGALNFEVLSGKLPADCRLEYGKFVFETARKVYSL